MKQLALISSRLNTLIARMLVGGYAFIIPTLAAAQTGTMGAQSAIGSMVDAVCSFIRPLTGKSPVVSLIFLLALGVMIFLWWMNESKEGVITWILRTGIAIGVIINLVTLPTLVGLPPVCG